MFPKCFLRVFQWYEFVAPLFKGVRPPHLKEMSWVRYFTVSDGDVSFCHSFFLSFFLNISNFFFLFSKFIASFFSPQCKRGSEYANRITCRGIRSHSIGVFRRMTLNCIWKKGYIILLKRRLNHQEVQILLYEFSLCTVIHLNLKVLTFEYCKALVSIFLIKPYLGV